MEFPDHNPVDSIVVAVGHNEFRKLTPQQLMSLCTKAQRPIIADVKGIFNKLSLEQVGFSVFRL